MESKRGWVATNRLKTKQLFGSIFPRDERMVAVIADHMLANGYDQSQPIVVWDLTEEEGNKNALYIVDGHTRKCAAATYETFIRPKVEYQGPEIKAPTGLKRIVPQEAREVRRLTKGEVTDSRARELGI
jgi:hypothetical protein